MDTRIPKQKAKKKLTLKTTKFQDRTLQVVKKVQLLVTVGIPVLQIVITIYLLMCVIPMVGIMIEDLVEKK